MTTTTRWFANHLLPKKWRDRLGGYIDGGYVAANESRTDFHKPYPPSNPAYKAPARPPPSPSPPLPRTAAERVVQIAVSDYQLIALTSEGRLFVRSANRWDLLPDPVTTKENDNEPK